MQVVLVMFKADGTRRSFSLPRDVTVLGRREDCDLRIPLGEVSRKHCRLIREDQTLRLEDLGSSNGTYLNGSRVQEAVVQPGDCLQIGPVQFFVQIDGVPADDQIQPAPPEAEALATVPEGEIASSVADGNGNGSNGNGHASVEAALSEPLPLETDEQALAHLASGDSATDALVIDLEQAQPDQKV